VGLISLCVLAVLTLSAIFAPWVAPYDPDQVDLAAVYANPSSAHWLGTDGLGRDIMSRMIYGARTALLAPLIVVITSTVVGILLGLLAGWRGGWIDATLARVFDVVFAFPSLLIAIMAVALFGKGLVAPVIAMSIAYAPFVARLTRSLVASERSRPYVSAYRVQGFSGGWIALRRVLPNVTPIVGAQSTLNFGYVLAELAALSFLGLGVQAPTADWGAMINEAQAGLLGGHFLPAIVPAVAVVIVVVAVNVIGEELSDRIGGGNLA
jgi:ABC-type dipeptide/oligopeptide/nickel transport system permease subunit